MTKPEHDAVADWRAKVNVCLLDGQVSACTRNAGKGGVKAYRIRTEPQLSRVACRPIILTQWLRKHKRNYVEVKTIVLAGRSVKSTARDTCVTGAGFPYGRHADVTAQRRRGDSGEHLTRLLLLL